MKKPAAALLAAVMLTVPAALAEDSTVYEAEEAQLNGKISVSADAKASGGKVVGRFENPTDTVTFTITVPADGVYDLTFVSKGIGGGKYNNVLVDGQDEGQFQCSGTTFEADTLRGILLSALPSTSTVWRLPLLSPSRTAYTTWMRPSSTPAPTRMQSSFSRTCASPTAR